MPALSSSPERESTPPGAPVAREEVPAPDGTLADELRSGFQTVRAVTEQLSVEQESIIALELISSVQSTIRSLQSPPTSSAPLKEKRRSTLLSKIKRPSSPPKLKKEMDAAELALSKTEMQIQELHLATIQRQVKRSVTLGAIDYLGHVKGSLRQLSDSLSESAPVDSLSSALQTFGQEAIKWLSLSDLGASPLVASSVSSGSGPTSLLLSASTSNPATSSFSNSSSSSAPRAVSEDSCPLETALRNANMFGRLTHSLSTFTSWATRENSFSDVHRLVGPVKSLHLMREKEAPLHHEFVLVSFEGESGSSENPSGKEGKKHRTSWLRIERAALLKSTRLMPKLDSFGPILHGAPLKESVSVSGSKEALVGRAEELGVVYASPANETDVPEKKKEIRFYLDDLAKQLLKTSENRPQYQLLTANCRWFARSTLLNSAERFSQAPVTVYSWAGTIVPFPTIQSRITKDRFGGKQLEGPRAELLACSNTIEHLASELLNGKPKTVLGSIKSVTLRLEKIGDAAEEKEKKTYLEAYVHYLHGTALRMLHHFSAALEPLEAARTLLLPHTPPAESRSNDDELLYLDVLAGLAHIRSCLGKDQRPASLALRVQVTEGWKRQRALHGEADVDSALGLVRALGFQARALVALHTTEHNASARALIDDAERLVRQTHERRDDLSEETYAWVLSQRAAILHDTMSSGAETKQLEEALEAISASVERTKALYAQKPEMIRRSLASRLSTQAEFAQALGNGGRRRGREFNVACEAARHALELYRVLYGQAPRSFGVDLQKTIRRLCKAVRLADDEEIVHRSLWTMHLVVASLRDLSRSSSSSADVGRLNERVFMICLRFYVHCLGKMHDPACRVFGDENTEWEDGKQEIEAAGVSVDEKVIIVTDL